MHVFVYRHICTCRHGLIHLCIIRTSTGILKLGMQQVLWKAGKCAGSFFVFFFSWGGKGSEGIDGMIYYYT